MNDTSEKIIWLHEIECQVEEVELQLVKNEKLLKHQTGAILYLSFNNNLAAMGIQIGECEYRRQGDQ